MLKKIKNLFSSNKITYSKNKNQELIDRLYEIIYMPNLNEILFSPSGKLYILNVYNTSFDEFLNNILAKNDRDIMAVNVNSYFKNRDNIQYKLKRAIDILEQNDISLKVQYEFNEIIDTVNFLKLLEEN